VAGALEIGLARPATVPWWRGWLPLVALPAAVLAAPPAWPAWAVMWSLAGALYAGFKWLTWRRTPVPGATAGRQLSYLVAWPGMDAAAFLDPRPLPADARPRAGEWLFAAGKFAAGLALLGGALRRVPVADKYWLGWAGMIGVALVLHFGSFHLLSCAWRAAGVNAKPLMDWPLTATGLADYWGKRWNVAFRDLMHRFLFRPLVPRLGPRGALLAGFAISGLIHDLVVSVPAGGGYGGPTLFFLLQGVAILAERSRPGRRLGLGRGWRGWLFTGLAVLGPARLLFHRPFVVGVVVPYLRAVGAV
jgi:hypothetical protein